MDLLWFLKLSLKCFDHFAWPFLALGYPLYASVQAIETDSYTEIRALISYWILLSSINLFEFAFMRLLLWFQFWPYIKLMVIFWLILPDFGRSTYVYNYLVHSNLSTKPQAVTSRLKNWKKLFVKKESFLLHAERYIEENGTEAFEKLIASKNTAHNPVAEATNAFRVTDKEMQQKEYHVLTNEKRDQTEHKEIKDLEVIERKEIPAGKKDIPMMSNLAPSQNASSVMVESKGMVGKDTAGEELPQSSAHKEVQKEWTCAVCQVKTSCEQNLNSHLNGRKHKANCEALKAKNQPIPQKLKNVQSKEELKQKNIINHSKNAFRVADKDIQQKEHHVQTNGEKHQTEHKDITDLEVIEKKEIPSAKKVGEDVDVDGVDYGDGVEKEVEEKSSGRVRQYPFRPDAVDCAFYMKTGNCKFGFNCNFNHPIRRENQDIPVMSNLAPSQNASSVMVENKGMVGKDTAGGELPQSSTCKEVQKEWTCAVCQVTTTCEKSLNSHLNGKKHKANCEAPKAKNQPIPQKLKNVQSKEELKVKNIIHHSLKGEAVIHRKGLKGKTVIDHKGNPVAVLL